MVNFAPVGPHLKRGASYIALIIVSQLLEHGCTFRPLFKHLAQLVLHEAGLLGQLTDLTACNLFALVDALAMMDRLAASWIRETVARINSERSWAGLLDDLQLVHCLAVGVSQWLPSLACAVSDNRTLDHAGAQHCCVMDQLAHFAVVVTLDKLVLNGGLHGLGFFPCSLHGSAGNVFHAQGLTGLWIFERLACVLVTGHACIAPHLSDVGLRRWLNAPVAIVRWKQDVRYAGFG